MKCSICGKEMIHPYIKDYLGNNPFPVRIGQLDRCCDECNDKYVLFARLWINNEVDENVKETIVYLLNHYDQEQLDALINIASMIEDLDI